MVFNRIRQYLQGQSTDHVSPLDQGRVPSSNNSAPSSERGQDSNETSLAHDPIPNLPPFPCDIGDDPAYALPHQESVSTLRKIAEVEALDQAIRDVETHYEAQQWQEVVDTCPMVFAIDPAHAPTYKMLGTASIRLGKRDDARSAYEQAIKIDPAFAEVYVNLGNLDAQEYRWDEAIAHYQQAIALKPDFAGAYRNLAKVWTQQGNKRLAAECLFHAVERDPDSLDLQGYFTLGNQLLEQGQPKQAIHCYRSILEQEQTQLAEGGAVSPSLRKIMPMLHQRLADALAQTKQDQELVIPQQRSPQALQSPQVPQTQLFQSSQSSKSEPSNSDPNGIAFKPAPGPSTFLSLPNASPPFFTVDSPSTHTLNSSRPYPSGVNGADGEGDGVVGDRLADIPLANIRLGDTHFADTPLELQQLSVNRLPLGMVDADIPNADAPSPVVPTGAIAPASYQQAEFLAEQGQWIQVINHLKQELEAVEPDINRRYELLAKACRMDGQVNEAIAYYQKMLVLQPNQAKTFANLGSLYAQQKQWENAIGAYRQAIQIEPEFAGAYRNLARVWQSTGNEDAAADCWVKAYGLEPDWGTAAEHLDLGHQLIEQGKIDAAIASFRRAVARDDTLTPAHFQLAELYRQSQHLDLALVHYGKTIQSDPRREDPNHSYAIYELGQILVQQGDEARGIACFNKLIDFDPSFVKGYEGLRDVLMAQGEIRQALRCYESLAQLQPDSSEVYHEWGDVLSQLEDWQAAVPAFQRAIELNPDFSWSHNNLGDALLRLEQWHSAAEAFRSAIALNPNFAWSHYNLGEALMQLQDWDGAIAAYRNALEQDSELSYGHQKLGDALKQRANADMQAALVHYDQAIQQDPAQVDSYHKRLELKKDDPDLYVQLANALLRRGERTEAIVACQMGMQVDAAHVGLKAMVQDLMQQEQAASHGDDHPTAHHSETESADPVEDLEAIADRSWDALFDLGNQFQLQGKVDAAVFAYEKAIEQNPSHSWSHHQLGDAYLKQERWSDAVRAYGDAIALNSDYFWSHYNLGVAYTRQGQWYEAIAAYRRSIEENPGLNLPCLALRDTLHKQWNSLFSKGDELLNMGDRDAARAFYRQAIRSYQEQLHLPSLSPEAMAPIPSVSETPASETSISGITSSESNAASDTALDPSASNVGVTGLSAEDMALEKLGAKIEKTGAKTENPAVLIVADDFLPQCYHYRVQQKLEQLAIAGFPSQYVSKQDTDAARYALHFCHIVIFYRVPALPGVIELIQYAKALGKVVIYEIDDLIFDEVRYPAPFETYGDRISMAEYQGLIRGATLFREAMALCDYAIGSTPALVTTMKPIVGQRKAFLHRNALDHLNTDFIDLNLPKLQRNYLSIFYGSGTKAHDTDFNHFAAPAIARIFEHYPHVRLTLVGYVTLPPILEPYGDRIDQVALIKEVDVYWELLQQADINIAVLQVKTETNCKSEIKWLEAAALGIPSVVSATQTYQEILTHGVDGFLARTPDDWFESLDRLVRDESVRQKVAQQAKAKAWQDYSLDAMAQNIRQILQATIADAQAERNPSHPPARRQNDRTIDHTASQPQPKLKTKLLIVNVFYPPQSIGGATRIVKDNVQVLAEEYGDRYDVSIFTTDDDFPVPYHMTQYTHNGIPVTKVSTPQEEGMDWRYENSKMYDIFREYLAFNPPDLIHFHCVQRLTGSVLEAAYDLDIPYLVTVHDAWWISDYQFLVNDDGVECSYQQNDPLVTAMEAKDVGRSLQRCRYLKQQLNRAQEIMAVSEAFADIYRQNGFPKTKANRNGIMPRPRLPRKPNPTGRVRFAHVGGMSAHKGYYLFKEAVESANLENSEVIIVDHSQTVGSVSYGQWGTTPVTFIAKVPQDQMPEFYSTIDVLVAPSMWPESFGLVTREAAAAGVWAIASDKGAIAEDIVEGKNGHICTVENSESLLQLLRNIDRKYTDPLRELHHPEQMTIRSTKMQVVELIDLYVKAKE